MTKQNIAFTLFILSLGLMVPQQVSAQATQTQCSDRAVSATYNYNFCRRNSAVPNGQPGAYSCESFSRTQRFSCFEAYNSCVYERYLRQTNCHVNTTNTGCVIEDTYGGTPPCGSGATLSPTSQPPTQPPAPTPTIAPPPPATSVPTPTPTSSNNPTGSQDLANCTQIAGWACDRDNPDAQIQVAIFNGPYNPSDTSNFLGYFPANAGGGNSADAQAIATACGSSNPSVGHRFVVTFPQEWRNGASYNLYIYGINIGGGVNTLLNNSPLTVNTASCLLTTAPTPTLAPTPTPSGACQLVRAYRPTGDLGIASNWGSPLTTAQLMQLRAGDTVYFTVVGNVTGGNVTAGRIRVNASSWSTRDVTTSFKPNPTGVDSSVREFYRAYVVPANTYSFTVGAEIYSPTLDTNTDMNDGNVGWR